MSSDLNRLRAEAKWLLRNGYCLKVVHEWCNNKIGYHVLSKIKQGRVYFTLKAVKPDVLPPSKTIKRKSVPRYYYPKEGLEGLKWMVNHYDYNYIKAWAMRAYGIRVTSDTLGGIKHGRTYKTIEPKKPDIFIAAPTPKVKPRWMVFNEVDRLRRCGMNEQYIKWHTGVGM